MTQPRDLISAEWLSIVGFKWHEVEPGRCKHWTLWLGGIAATDTETGKQDVFTGDEDLGIELSETIGEWYCWMRADYSGRYSRFIHIRHLHYQDEVKQLVAAMSGRPWNPANHIYGKIFTRQPAGKHTRTR